MDTRGYGYNLIRVRIHIIVGSQIPVYYTREYPFNYSPPTRDGFYPQVSMGMGIFATPSRASIFAHSPSSWTLSLELPTLSFHKALLF